MIFIDRIRNVLIKIIIAFLVCLFLLFISEFAINRTTIIIADLVTQNKTYNTALADEPYPPPTIENPAQDNSGATLPYPPPDNEQSNTDNLPTLPPIPTDRIVAVYSTGEFSDINIDISDYPDIVQINGDSMYVPPTYPEYSENPESLRIIGGDDRFQIFNTKVFPWSTVVKINGQWNQNSFLIA